ncbi:MAG: type I DNA topoisomerase [Treponema sp.]
MAGVKKTIKKNDKEKKSLLIVESPAKAKTIERYLGKSYMVKASMGHLMDLPKSRLGIDVEHDFTPEYITVRGRAKLLKELKKDAKLAKNIYLASDNDREGEAIAWHLKSIFQDECDAPISRIVFNEITPQAIKDAVKAPKDIDEDKVKAQKARRVLDRLVGYNLSPILWAKVKNGLSAGRVQSVALRLICEREDEVQRFIPEEYFTLEGEFKKNKTKFKARLEQYKGKEIDKKDKKEFANVMEAIKGSNGIVIAKKDTIKSIKPKPPFITSTLQQVAANRLNFTSKKTMQVAQQLYEGISVGSKHIGLITYMRTDSVRISSLALEKVRTWIGENYPENLPDKAQFYAVGESSQDAHECIRPTFMEYTPSYLEKYLSKEQFKLYSLIWERFIASQMKNAKTITSTYDIDVKDAIFRTSSTKFIEKGFYSIVNLLLSKDDKAVSTLDLNVKDEVEMTNIELESHFTQGPSRYTDASIVKTLEEKRIGRPSTYAPIISVLLDRFYVTRSNKQLVPTQLGKVINNLLVSNFSDIIDVNFTAEMERKLDEVEEDKIDWINVIRPFYTSFVHELNAAMEKVSSMKGKMDETTDVICEQCGKKMIKRLGRFGYFLACSGFPECKNTKSIPLAKCPVEGCGGDIVARKGSGKKKTREFYGCSNFPKCNFVSYFKPTDSFCPKCGWFLVEKYDKSRGSYHACINPKCDHLHTVVKGVEDENTK